jgi:hypothetical protein
MAIPNTSYVYFFHFPCYRFVFASLAIDLFLLPLL